MADRLLLVALLCGTAAAAAVQPRLPQGVDQWDYFTGTLFERNRPPDSRFWDRSWLRRATAAVDAERIGRVLDKLNAGRPIVVMAFGSSVTAKFGGLFEPRPGLVASLAPMAVLQQPHYGDGWLRMMMTQINSTWPHPDHLLYNAARLGSCFIQTAEASCMEATLPNVGVDLVVAEFIPRVSTNAEDFSDTTAAASTGQLEKFMGRLFAHFSALHLPAPAYVFLKPLSLAYDVPKYRECLAPGLGCRPAGCAASFKGPFDEPGRDVAVEWRAEARVHDVVRYYGQTSLSIRSFLAALAISAAATQSSSTSSSTTRSSSASSSAISSSSSSTLHAIASLPKPTLYARPFNYSSSPGHDPATPPGAAAMTSCEMGRHLYFDLVHPSKLGQVLYADLLINLLADAESHLLGMPQGGGDGGGFTTATTTASASTSSSSSSASAPRPELPLVPLTPGGRQVWQQRCYGDLPSRLAETDLVGWAGPGDKDVFRDTGVHPLLLRDGHEGWTHVTNQVHVTKEGDPPKYKPGWVATTVGARLRIEVNAIFPNHTASSTPTTTAAAAAALPSSSPSSSTSSTSHPSSFAPSSYAILSIMYLRSYQHMGTARVACVRHCECAPLDIDANHQEPVSVTELARLRLDVPHAQCLLEVTILPKTASSDGEHKFKVIQVVVAAPL